MGILATEGGSASGEDGTTTTNGAYALGGTLIMSGTSVTATGGPSARAVVTDNAVVQLADVTLSATGGATTNYGIHSIGSFATSQTSVRDSAISSGGSSIRNDGGAIYVDDTQLSSAAAGVGTTQCRNAYTSTLGSWGANCT